MTQTDEVFEADIPDEIVTVTPESGVGRKISVTFERKVGLPNYSTVTARAWGEAVVPLDASEKDVNDALASLFLPVKTAVFQTLGIEFEFDAESGNVVETSPVQAVANQINAAFPGTTEQDAPHPAGANSSAPQGAQPGGHGITIANLSDASPDPLPDWLLASLARDGVTRIYDNRKTATGNQPLFKEAVGRGLQGHGKDGKQAAYWPPK